MAELTTETRTVTVEETVYSITGLSRDDMINLNRILWLARFVGCDPDAEVLRSRDQDLYDELHQIAADLQEQLGTDGHDFRADYNRYVTR